MAVVHCEDRTCKHNGRGNMCSKTIEIGSNGRCKSYEKGFLYYFGRVWRALRGSNYIDFVEINADDDLRIGIYYVCKAFGIGFSEMEWGTCRMLMFKSEDGGKALDLDDFSSMEMDEEVFNELYQEFMDGKMPTVNRTKPKKSDQPFGWLSPTGEFIEADFAEHEEAAEKIAKDRGFLDEYRGSEYCTCRDFLCNAKGYCLIHNPTGDGGYIVSNVKPLTKKQKEFLYGYFADIGDTFKAEQYID